MIFMWIFGDLFYVVSGILGDGRDEIEERLF